jgi:hypothetical protein
MDFNNSPKQFKKQLHIYSGSSNQGFTLQSSTKRNRILLTLAEPISCKDNQYLTVRVQRVIFQRSASWTWTDGNGNGPFFLYLTSNALRSTNFNNNNILSTVPIGSPAGYVIDYENISNIETIIGSKEITIIDLSLVNPDFTDIINTSADFLIVLEFNAYSV